MAFWGATGSSGSLRWSANQLEPETLNLSKKPKKITSFSHKRTTFLGGSALFCGGRVRKGCSIFWFPSFELKEKHVEKTRADGKTILPPFGQLGGFCFRQVQLVNCFFFRFLVVCFPQTATLQTLNFAASVFCCFHSWSGGWYIFVECFQLGNALKNMFMFIIVVFYFQYPSFFLDDWKHTFLQSDGDQLVGV